MSAQSLIEQTLSLETSLGRLAMPLQNMLDEARYLRCARLRFRCSSLVNRIVVAVAAGRMPDVPDAVPQAFGAAAGKAAGAAALANVVAADEAMQQASAALEEAEALVPAADAPAA